MCNPFYLNFSILGGNDLLFCIRIVLYGSLQARSHACGILENLPQVKRVECSREKTEIRITTDDKLNENSLLPLLRRSGVSGFRLIE